MPAQARLIWQTCFFGIEYQCGRPRAKLACEGHNKNRFYPGMVVTKIRRHDDYPMGPGRLTDVCTPDFPSMWGMVTHRHQSHGTPRLHRQAHFLLESLRPLDCRSTKQSRLPAFADFGV